MGNDRHRSGSVITRASRGAPRMKTGIDRDTGGNCIITPWVRNRLQLITISIAAQYTNEVNPAIFAFRRLRAALIIYLYRGHSYSNTPVVKVGDETRRRSRIGDPDTEACSYTWQILNKHCLWRMVSIMVDMVGLMSSKP